MAMDFIQIVSLSYQNLNFMRGMSLLDKFPPHFGMNMQTLVETDSARYPSRQWTALKSLLLRPCF